MKIAVVFFFAAIFAVVGCSNSSNSSSTTTTTVETPPRLVTGADISELKSAEDGNVKFYDTDGTEKSAVTILYSHGFRYARIRLVVTANGKDGISQNIDYVKALALQAKAAGFGILLDIFYSDTWCDPASQTVPSTWSSYTVALITTAVHDFTKSSIIALRDAGAMPDIVQTGNELNDGMIWPTGRISVNGWTNFAAYLAAARQGIEDGRGTYAMPKIMIHYAGITDAKTFYTSLLAKGATFDFIGLSYYPMWHGTFSDLSTGCTALSAAFGKDIYIVETAYYWNTPWPSGLSYTAPYPLTYQGQYDFLYNLSKTVSVIDAVKGIFYWGSCWSQHSLWLDTTWTGDEDDRRALFDYTGKACPAIDALTAAQK